MENQNLTLNDMVSLRTIIDVSCSRGAFKAGEMKAIGEVYEKLDRFIAQSQPQELPAENSQPQGE